MTTDHFLRSDNISTPIDTGLVLGDGARKAFDYVNGTNLDMLVDFFWDGQYNTAIPSAGDIVSEMWVMGGDGQGGEDFPNGGDGTVGDDNDPQAEYSIGKLTSIAPSLTVNEVLGYTDVRLKPGNNRLVIKNISAQEWDATWEVRARATSFQSVDQ